MTWQTLSTKAILIKCKGNTSKLKIQLFNLLVTSEHRVPFFVDEMSNDHVVNLKKINIEY